MAIRIRPHPDHGVRRLPRGLGRWSVRAAAAVIVVAGGVAVSRTSLFHARSVEVSGASTLSRAQLVELASVDQKTNVVWLDEGAAERRLESNPWVADAEVRVSLTLVIRISVTERVPVAVASDGRESVLVASDGTALGPALRSGSARGLPLIELPGEGFTERAAQTPVGAALALAAMDADLRSQVDRVSVLSDGTLELWLRSGPRVSFGTVTAVELKAQAIARALAWAIAEGERVVSLSVVAPSAPAATLAP